MIRKIKSSDKTELLEIMNEFYNSPALLHHTPERVLSRVIDDCNNSPYLDGYVYVADGVIAGYTMAAIGYSTEYGGISIMIEDLCVKKDFRGKGIGTALLEFVERQYAGKAVRLRLEVAPDNTAAIALYSRLGFSNIDYVQLGKLLNE